MRSKNWLGIPILLTGLGLLALPAFAQQNQSSGAQQQTGDSLADAARKAREQKKDAKPKKVFTDDDIKHSSSETSSASGTAQGAGGGTGGGQATGAGTGAGGGTGEAGDEASWKKRFAEQRGKIATAEKELDILQREEEKAQVQYYPDPQKALKEQYSRKDINDKQAKIDAKKQEIANLKQQLSDMEDELRKSGGDPGWARE